MRAPRDTYKYHFKRDNKILHSAVNRSISEMLTRRVIYPKSVVLLPAMVPKLGRTSSGMRGNLLAPRR